jgi:hypothetical protein
MVSYLALKAGGTLEYFWSTLGFVKWSYVGALTPDDYTIIDKQKGVIVDSPSAYAEDFNDCHHIELYGEYRLPFTCDSEFVNKLPWGFDIQINSDLPYKDGEHRYITVTHKNEWEVVQTMPRGSGRVYVYLSYVVWQPAKKRSGSRRMLMTTVDSARLNATLADARMQYAKERTAYWDALPDTSSVWTYPIGRARILSSVSTGAKTLVNLAKERVEVALNLYASCCRGADELSKSRNQLLVTALNSTSELEIYRQICEIGLDGLIIQALSQLRMAEIPAYDFREIWEASGKFQLGVQYGVLAPYRDYLDLFDKLRGYYAALFERDADAHGLIPFFQKASVARETVQESEWTHKLIFGIQWDYLHGSTLEDFFGTLHTVGLCGLSPAQVYELLPLSFAVNWFINLGSVFEQCDAMLNAMRYPVRYCWETYLSTKRVSIDGNALELRVYDRHALAKLPAVHFQLDSATLRGTLSTSNYDQAVALLT